MNAHAYLTKYDGLLCKSCALKTDDLVDDGKKWLNGLTAISVSELWAEACCEECKQRIA